MKVQPIYPRIFDPDLFAQGLGAKIEWLTEEEMRELWPPPPDDEEEGLLA